MSYEKELRELHLMQQIYATIFSLANKLQAEGDKCFDDLTVRQFMTMLAVLHLPAGETSLNRIAEKTGTTKQNINHMITALGKKGLVEINPSQTDKRAMNVTLTEAGEYALYTDSKKSVVFMADLFAEFSEEELALLWKMLKKLYQFDGQMQSGFEEEASLQIVETDTTEQQQLIAEFQRLRNREGDE